MSRSVTRITVAVATRHRPRMLADLLQSFMALDVPQGAEVAFIVVENDSALSIAELVDDFAKRSGWPAKALLEPRIGIAHARNRALEEALTDGADWLAFVDDDEQVRHDWLRILWAGAKEAGAQLAGGPLRPVAPPLGCSDSEALVLEYYQRAAQISDTRREAAQSVGRRFDLATNNWLADLAAVEEAGLRFDTAFNLSGGEDTDFSRRAHAAGLKLAWVPGAIVTEEVPAERLTATYIYERARHQSITKQQLKTQDAPKTARLDALMQILSKGVSGALRIAISPLAGRYHYLRGLRALGVASGFWAALRGRTQSQYKEVTGE